MSITDETATSQHLVDPDLLRFAETYPDLNLGPETLPLVRAGIEARPQTGPDLAELFPTVMVTERRIPGLDGDPDVRVLHYEPREPTAPTAALVWMHSGGFVLGSADQDEKLCRQIVHATGAAVVAVDYRLAPETPAPGPVHDSYAALRWVYEHADTVGIDPTRIAIGGASAGGGLAASLAILARDLGEVPVVFQLLIYPMLDDRTASTSTPHPYAGDFVWTPSDNRFGWSSYLGREPGVGDVSPYSAAARVESVVALPPTFLAVGALDLFLEEGVAYATRLIRGGIPTELHVHPGAFHGFDQVATARATKAHLVNVVDALRRAWGAPGE